MLITCDGSLLAMEKLCDRAGDQEAAVAGLYFNFAVQKEQPPARVLGIVLKQIVSELEKVPKGIAQAYRDQKKAIGGWGRQLGDIVEMLQATAGERPTFICIDTRDECVARYRRKLLDSLNQILQRSPSTRVKY